ncbi:HNH endonuclease [Salisediminibacterium beveridgei]|nr:HNH endonuclease signature motif containing protein [Salisediminibacterium beveridgei]
MNKFDRFMKNNNINRLDLEDVIYQSFLLTIFQEIVQKLEKSNIEKALFKSKLRNTRNHKEEIMELDRFIKDKVGLVALESDELHRLLMLFKAYLTKSNSRRNISTERKRELLQQQNSRCVFCDNNITLESCNIDHIIPFKYVGDELINNTQGLCQNCNGSKSAKLIHLMELFLRNRKISSKAL